MQIRYAAHPELFRGTGTAFIVWEPDVETYAGYWDRLPDGRQRLLSRCRVTDSLEGAVEWGPKACCSGVDPAAFHPDRYFWAGAGDPGGADAVLPRLVLYQAI
jgi:hypothetical protein